MSSSPLPSGQPPVAAHRRSRRKDARPGELLDAALQLFVEKGFAATRVEEVAARAGVSKGTLFLYFSSKEELFKAVVRANIAGLLARWHKEIDAFEGSTAEMLRHGLSVWWEKVGATPASGITKLMMSEARNFPEIAAFYQREVVQPGRELLRRMLRRGMERGEFRAIDPDYALFSILSGMLFLVLAQHSDIACVAPGAPALDPQTYLACQVDVLLNGLLKRPEVH